MTYSIMFGTTPRQTDLWEALAGVLQDNPLLTLIGWSLAVFGAGFAARRYFQDRELDRVKAQLLEVQQQLTTAMAKLRSVQEGEEESRNRLDRIADCIAPNDIRKQLGGVLKHWPEDRHDLIVAGVIRQLIVTPGRAWICTPSGATLVKVDWDQERGACRVGSETDSSVDPIKELRGFVRKPEVLKMVLLDLAVYGITSVSERTTPTTLKIMKVRQGPGLGWHIDTQILERVSQ